MSDLDINVKDVLGTEESEYTPSAFRCVKWDAESAFGRLQVSRETQKMLIAGINENASDLPVSIRVRYDKVIKILKEIEKDEIQLIAFGE